MARKRIRLTNSQYTELTEARVWCAQNGMTGLRDFYDEELAFQAWRRALPVGSQEYDREPEEPRGRTR